MMAEMDAVRLTATVELLETQLRDRTQTHNKEVAELRELLDFCQTNEEQSERHKHELTQLVESLQREKVALEGKNRELQEQHERDVEEMRCLPNAPLVLPHSTSKSIQFLCDLVVTLRQKYAKSQSSSQFFKTQLQSLLSDIEEKSGSITSQRRYFAAVSDSYLKQREQMRDLVATEETQASVISELQSSLREEKARSKELQEDCVAIASQTQSLLHELERMRTNPEGEAAGTVRSASDVHKENIELRRRLRDVWWRARTDQQMALQAELEAKSQQISVLQQKLDALERAQSADPPENSQQRNTQTCYECREKESKLSELREEIGRLSDTERSLSSELSTLQAEKAALETELRAKVGGGQIAKEEMTHLEEEIAGAQRRLEIAMSDNQRIRSQSEVVLAANAAFNSKFVALEQEYYQLATSAGDEKTAMLQELRETQAKYEKLQQESSLALLRLTADRENLLFQMKSLRNFDEFENTSSEVAGYKSEISRLKAVNLSLESENVQMRRSVSTQQSESSRPDCMQPHSIFVRLRERLQMAVSDAEASKVQNHELIHELRSVISQLEQANCRIGELEAANAGLVEQRQSAQALITASEARSAQLERDYKSAVDAQNSLRSELRVASAPSARSLTRLTTFLYRQLKAGR